MIQEEPTGIRDTDIFITHEHFLEIGRMVSKMRYKGIYLSLKLTIYGFYLEQYRKFVARHMDAHYKKTQSWLSVLFPEDRPKE